MLLMDILFYNNNNNNYHVSANGQVTFDASCSEKQQPFHLPRLLLYKRFRIYLGGDVVHVQCSCLVESFAHWENTG